MISFRYHVASIVAVFLAITLGIFIGSAVVPDALVDRLRGDVGRARDARDEAQDRGDGLQKELTRQQSVVEKQIGPWAVDGSLAGVPVVFVFAAARPELADVVTRVLASADATVAGAITFSKSLLADDVDIEALRALGIQPDPSGSDVSVAKALATRGFNASAREFQDGLVAAGALSIDGRGEQEWPPPGSMFVVVSENDEGIEILAEFAGATSLVRPTLVLSPDPETPSPVERLSGVVAPMLSTFDSVSLDPSGVGVVASAVAALQSRGGKFGTSSGLTFVPPRQ